MATQPSQALSKRSAATDLMPPPSVKRIKRPPKILDEDEYADAVSQIIERDFFPGLEQTRTQMEFLDAVESQDDEWISKAGHTLTRVMTPGPQRRITRSMAPFSTMSTTPKNCSDDTPTSTISESFSTITTQAKSKVNTDIRLDTFLSKYTGEDNESFYKVIDKQNQKRAEKYAWIYQGNKILAPRQLKHREREEKLIKSKAAQEAEDSGVQLLAIEGKDDRKAMADSWNSKPNNQLMFSPESIEDQVVTVQQRAEAESKMPPKVVVYDNTRLPSAAPEPEKRLPPSPSLSAVQDAIAGRPRPTDSEPGYTGAETPRVNGYAFVDDEEPPPTTHAFMPRADTMPNPFKIREQSKRESLHHRMVDKVSRDKRTSSVNGMNGRAADSSIPKFPSSPSIRTPLTPAAERLWSKLGSSSPKRPGVFGGRTGTTGLRKESGLKFRWTPTPKAEGRGKT
ncbi:MAG: hypothetical protein M1824_006137 [Vezdaea acicularis]|nr:MAG: hypothetical protein M1824_006137 [Vezdaea acicularis]